MKLSKSKFNIQNNLFLLVDRDQQIDVYESDEALSEYPKHKEAIKFLNHEQKQSHQSLLSKIPPNVCSEGSHLTPPRLYRDVECTQGQTAVNSRNLGLRSYFKRVPSDKLSAAQTHCRAVSKQNSLKQTCCS